MSNWESNWRAYYPGGVKTHPRTEANESLHKNQINGTYDWMAESSYSAAIKDVEDCPVL